jgi:hypothetical protein
MFTDKPEEWRNEGFSSQKAILTELDRILSRFFGPRIEVIDLTGTPADWNDKVDADIVYNEKNDMPSLQKRIDLKTKFGDTFCFTWKNAKGENYFRVTKATDIVFASENWFYFVPVTDLVLWIGTVRPAYSPSVSGDGSQFFRITEEAVKELCSASYPRKLIYR